MKIKHTIDDLRNEFIFLSMKKIFKFLKRVEKELKYDRLIILEEYGSNLKQYAYVDETNEYFTFRIAPIWVSSEERKNAVVARLHRLAEREFGMVEITYEGAGLEDKVTFTYGWSANSIGD